MMKKVLKVKLIKICLFVIAIVLCIKYLPEIYQYEIDNSNNRVDNASYFTLHDMSPGEFIESNEKLILYWTSFFHWNMPYVPYNNYNKSHCKEKRCQTTTDRTKLQISDAVMIHIRNLDKNDLPSLRTSSQRWIFYLFESPRMTFRDLDSLNYKFNWTMTYRQDSDIYFPYGLTLPRSEANINDFGDPTPYIPNKNYALNKTELVAWIVSNCYTSSNRESFVKELQNYLPVHIYGWCGTKSCPSEGDCDVSKYKFYLSFENAYCLDYVTEKFFKMVKYGVIPIVLGGANYSLFAPPKSYIDVKDFKTVKDLSEWLLYLNSNDDAFNDYFKWRKDYIIYNREVEMIFWCNLCQKLHDRKEPQKIYNSIVKWWYKKGNCTHKNFKFIL